MQCDDCHEPLGSLYRVVGKVKRHEEGHEESRGLLQQVRWYPVGRTPAEWPVDQTGGVR